MKYIAVQNFDDGSKGFGLHYEPGDKYLGDQGEVMAAAGLVVPEKDFKTLAKAEEIKEELKNAPDEPVEAEALEDDEAEGAEEPVANEDGESLELTEE